MTGGCGGGPRARRWVGSRCTGRRRGVAAARGMIGRGRWMYARVRASILPLLLLPALFLSSLSVARRDLTRGVGVRSKTRDGVCLWTITVLVGNGPGGGGVGAGVASGKELNYTLLWSGAGMGMCVRRNRGGVRVCIRSTACTRILQCHAGAYMGSAACTRGGLSVSAKLLRAVDADAHVEKTERRALTSGDASLSRRPCILLQPRSLFCSPPMPGKRPGGGT
ncbi:hypothetical protein K438DRAFT_90513 [Mycena galopus ATCC 62051]|nr:hypothetical protein K438DRAFT_90513 [Mycena galopus ATCC 62051]